MQKHSPPEFVDFKCIICKEYRGFNWSDQHGQGMWYTIQLNGRDT